MKKSIYTSFFYVVLLLKFFETAIMVLEKIEMVKKMIKLIAVDMDGTFFR